MSLNVFNLSGTVEQVSFKPAGTDMGSYRLSYPELSAKVSFGNVEIPLLGTENKRVPVGPQTLWVKLNLPERDGPQKATMFENRVNQGARFFLLSNGTFSQWTSKNNEVRSEIKASLASLQTGANVLAALNHAVIQGEVKNQGSPWFYVEDRYRNPSERDPAKAWKSRMIPVYCPVTLPNLDRRQVLVIGRLSVQTPVAQPDGSLLNKPFLHVVAQEVHACL